MGTGASVAPATEEMAKAVDTGWRVSEAGQILSFADDDDMPCSYTVGMDWEEVSLEETRSGTEISNEELSKALQQKLKFSTEEWATFGVTDLPHESYVKVEGRFYVPSRTVRSSSNDRGPQTSSGPLLKMPSSLSEGCRTPSSSSDSDSFEQYEDTQGFPEAAAVALPSIPGMVSHRRQSLKHLSKEEALFPVTADKSARRAPSLRKEGGQRKSLADLKRPPSSAAQLEASKVQLSLNRQNSSVQRQRMIDKSMNNLHREEEALMAEKQHSEDQLRRRLEERRSRRKSKISKMGAVLQAPAESHELNAIESMLEQMLQEHAQHEHHDAEELQELEHLKNALSFVREKEG